MSERYEEVRRALIARGYLHGRIERFVLRDALAFDGSRALAGTTFKAALLGAPILGGLLSASTVAANRPGLTARDALVLWLYFTAFALVVLFVLDLAAATLAAAWARRRGAQPDAWRTGLVVAVPVLIYLIVAWALSGTRREFGWDAAFVILATATAALVAWLAGLVSLAGIVGRTGNVPDRKRRSVARAIAVLLPVAVVLALATGTSSQNDKAIPPSAFASVPRNERLLVLGIDGLDGALIASTSARGATEHLLALMERGAVYPKRREDAEPAEIWTTIATGMPVDAHGVRTAGATRLPGLASPIAPRSGPGAADAALRFLLPSRTVPASGSGRRVRALWEIAGLTSKAAVVGWWASWPARGTEGDPVSGYVVSDRVLAKLLLEGPEDHDTAPASLYARIALDFNADRSAWRSEFGERFSAVPPDASALAWESFLIDVFAWRTSLRLLRDPEVATSFTYLPGLDILRTRLSDHPERDEVVVSYVRWLDATVFAGLATVADARIVVIADPGRSAAARAEGFVAIAGAGAAARCVGPTIGDLDVAPIVLRAASLPVSLEMTGRVPARCFESHAAEPRPIATWGRRGRSSEPPQNAYDEEMVERLKTLGYVR